MRVIIRDDRMIVGSDAKIPSELSVFSRSRSFPVCGDILRRLKVANPSLELGYYLKNRMKEIKDQQDLLNAIKSREDDDGDPRLYPYQRVGVKWLLTIKRGILADDQGLGKTVEAAAACNCIKNTEVTSFGSKDKEFIRGPLNIGVICNGSNISGWTSHMIEYFKQGRIWQDKNRGVAVVDHEDFSHTFIVNYDNAAGLRYIDLNILIVDEAHHIRNRKTRAFKIIKGLAKKIEYVFLLTASPTINYDQDMWGLLYLCDPARFVSYWSYIFRFFDVSQSPFGIKIGGVKETERYNLSNIASTYVLSRDESVLKLPNMSRGVVQYHLGDEHRSIYDQMEDAWVASLGDKSVSASVKVAQVTRLRQLAISPNLLFDDYSGRDKIDALAEIITDSKPTVVFTMFEQAAELVKERLSQGGISCETLTGQTRNRDDILQRFGQDFRVLAVTYGTGGESLTLTQAKRAILLDLAWHPAGLRHAAKRIHRIGQDEEVEMIVIKSVDTIEEHIEDIIRTKGKVSVSDLIRRMRK